MAVMPKAFPPEFRDEVVRVARRREQSLRQTAIDFGISESCLNRWLALDEIETGDRPGVTKAEAAETRELKKRNKILEEENLILRRAAAFFAKEMLPK
jgi:transposase